MLHTWTVHSSWPYSPWPYLPWPYLLWPYLPWPYLLWPYLLWPYLLWHLPHEEVAVVLLRLELRLETRTLLGQVPVDAVEPQRLLATPVKLLLGVRVRVRLSGQG